MPHTPPQGAADRGATVADAETTHLGPSAPRTHGLREQLAPMAQVLVWSAASGIVILLQDVLMAARFAAAADVDAYQLAVSVPMAAINVFSGGTLLAVAVPRLVKLQVDGHWHEAPALVRSLRSRVVRVLVPLCLAWAALFPWLVATLSSDLSSSSQGLSVTLTWAVLPIVVMSGLAWVEMAVLNSHRRFALVSAFPAMMPAGVVVAVATLGARVGVAAAAGGLLCGSLAQWALARRQSVPLLGLGRRESAGGTSGDSLGAEYVVAAASAAMLTGIQVSDTYAASTLDAGSVATFGYASRPVVLGLALATAVVGNVALPSFARLVAAREFGRLRRTFVVLSTVLVALAVPAIGLVYARADELVRLLLERGSFTTGDTLRVAGVLQVYVLHVPAFLVGMLAWRVLNSLERHRAVLVLTAVAFLVNLGSDAVLSTRLGLVGVAWGTNIAMWLWAALLCAYLARAERLRSTQGPGGG